MGRGIRPTDAFAAAYPNVARWVRDEGGWIELGSDENSASFVRVLNEGGMAWEGEPDYPSIDAAFAADAGIAAWFASEEAPATAVKAPVKKAPAKKKPTAGMKRVSVDSSMVIAIGYDEATKELEAVFRTGAVWRYRDVPKKVWKQLLAASSKGSYMRDLVIGVYAEYQVRR
jgi:hypothetical protein